MFGRAGSTLVTGAGFGRRLVVGFGSDLVRRVGLQDAEPATLDFRVVPGCPPEPRSSGGEVDLELTPDGVADPSFQRAQRFLLGLPLSDLAVVVDAAGRVVTDLGDHDEMHRMIEFAVPARVEPMPFPRSAGRLDRRGPVVRREPGRCREPRRDHRREPGSTRRRSVRPYAAQAAWSRTWRPRRGDGP